uniref:hypothetical protein n=1 Tax=Alcaligenes sp. EGD-AK7 TaxID=1386079 RepID=UPI00128F2EAE|nr:hypothetical protein [Alcaligenes sp. EGD-AK7]
MKKGVTRTPIDDAGIFGTQIVVDPNVASFEDTVNALNSLAPQGRIDALREVTELSEIVKRLQEQIDRIDQTYGPSRRIERHENGRVSISYPVLDELTRSRRENDVLKLLLAISNAEALRSRIKATPYINSNVKDKRHRKKIGILSAEERQAERRPEWDKWQKRANELFSINPLLTVNAVARRIAPEFSVSLETVRKRIKKVGT